VVLELQPRTRAIGGYDSRVNTRGGIEAGHGQIPRLNRRLHGPGTRCHPSQAAGAGLTDQDGAAGISERLEPPRRNLNCMGLRDNGEKNPSQAGNESKQFLFHDVFLYFAANLFSPLTGVTGGVSKTLHETEKVSRVCRASPRCEILSRTIACGATPPALPSKIRQARAHTRQSLPLLR
jgi:hypothetical protein